MATVVKVGKGAHGHAHRGRNMVTEHHRTLQEQSESIHHDIQAHLTGIHGEHKGKRQPYWETSPCHGTFPCDYLDRLSKAREQLATAIQRQHSEDYRNGFAHGRDVGMATSAAKYAGVLQCCTGVRITITLTPEEHALLTAQARDKGH